MRLIEGHVAGIVPVTCLLIRFDAYVVIIGDP